MKTCRVHLTASIASSSTGANGQASSSLSSERLRAGGAPGRPAWRSRRPGPRIGRDSEASASAVRGARRARAGRRGAVERLPAAPRPTGQPFANRPPSAAEVKAGLPLLQQVLADRVVLAVGRQAESAVGMCLGETVMGGRGGRRPGPGLRRPGRRRADLPHLTAGRPARVGRPRRQGERPPPARGIASRPRQSGGAPPVPVPAWGRERRRPG